MKQIPIKLGPLAFLLTVISICLTVLAILTFTTARADLSLADKYAQTVQIRYDLEAQGQAYLAQLAAGQGTGDTDADADGVIWKTFSRDGFSLRVGCVAGADGYEVISWRQEKAWDEENTLHVWQGN